MIQPCEAPTDCGNSRLTVQERARRYLAKIPGAISGRGGHDTTYQVTCSLFRKFALSDADVFDLLSDWNKTCQPPWSESELRHKIQSAGKAGGCFTNPTSTHRIVATTPSERLCKQAAEKLPLILEQFRCNQDDFSNTSPISILEVEKKNQWRLFLKTMFEPDDVLWIGQVANSGMPFHADHFRTQRQWLESDNQSGNFICPSTFKAGSYRRTLENRLESPYFVFESDKLDKDQQCAVIKWCQQFLILRAITYSGGKSLHAWFERPPTDVLADLRTISHALNLDPASSRDVQPVRLAGVFRKDKQSWQTLVYLSPKKGTQV